MIAPKQPHEAGRSIRIAYQTTTEKNKKRKVVEK